MANSDYISAPKTARSHSYPSLKIPPTMIFPQKHATEESYPQENQIQTRNRNNKEDKYSFMLIRKPHERLCNNLGSSAW